MSAASQIGLALKGRKSGNGWLVRCPCPNHGSGRGDRAPSLSIHDGDDGRLLLKCFAGCEFQDILASLRQLGLVGEMTPRDRTKTALRRVDPRSEPHHPDPFGIQIWRDAKPANGTVVEDYLKGRAISLLPPSIRCGVHLQLGRYAMPAMIAGVQRPDGAVVAVQSTVLTPKGKKAAIAVPKITTGALGFGAIRFARAAPIMGIAEGVETALSAQIMFGMPVWASLGCHRLHRVDLPSLVEHVHVFGDNDQPGRDAAERAGQHHRSIGRCVTFHFPPDGVKDFNDAARAGALQTGAAA